jgi:hypothetical protein
MNDFPTLVDKIQTWMEATGKANVGLSTERSWCILGIEDLTQEGLREYFDRSELNQKFTEEFQNTEATGTPYTLLQTESDLIYSLHKSMAARHKGRLMSYRDDCSQKQQRTYSAISLGLIKYKVHKAMAEKLG